MKIGTVNIIIRPLGGEKKDFKVADSEVFEVASTVESDFIIIFILPSSKDLTSARWNSIIGK
jgi:hypothetical protein